MSAFPRAVGPRAPTVSDLGAFFVENGGRILLDNGVPHLRISRIEHAEVALGGDLAWLRSSRVTSRASVVVGHLSAMDRIGWMMPRLAVSHDNPRELLAKTIRRFYAHRTAVPHENGHYEIGRGTEIHETALLGIEAQNYQWINDRYEPFPAIGGVDIGADVRVGPFATICRGALGDTTIGDGCRVGQHVNIGHDVRIGANTLVVAHSSIAGWARIGHRVKIYQGARIRNGVTIGACATIGMGAVVLTDVPDGEIWGGNPARKLGSMQ